MSDPSKPLLVIVAANDPYLARGLMQALLEHGVTVLEPDDDPPPEWFSDDDGDMPRRVTLNDGAADHVTDGPVLAIIDDDDGAIRSLQSGAIGVVRRGIDTSSLVAALHAVSHGFHVVDARLGGVTGALLSQASSTASGASASGREGPNPVRPASGTGSSSTATDRGPLTEREHEVLGLLTQGFTNKEIAASLGVTVHTSKFHVNGILEKLGAMTRTEAVAIAVRSGIIHL